MLIDEYDIPLENSYFEGFYNEMISILNRSYGEFFGFDQVEIDQMLEYYGLSKQRDQIKNGITDICSVIQKYITHGV